MSFSLFQPVTVIDTSPAGCHIITAPASWCRQAAFSAIAWCHNTDSYWLPITLPPQDDASWLPMMPLPLHDAGHWYATAGHYAMLADTLAGYVDSQPPLIQLYFRLADADAALLAGQLLAGWQADIDWIIIIRSYDIFSHIVAASHYRHYHCFHYADDYAVGHTTPLRHNNTRQ